ncbi:hypothetical protein BDR04DRAFT_421881 [Suillus decipiens]|nr:hypothetical protein BDR04DRAFT_421881 [Suillus decipiens]
MFKLKRLNFEVHCLKCFGGFSSPHGVSLTPVGYFNARWNLRTEHAYMDIHTFSFMIPCAYSWSDLLSPRALILNSGLVNYSKTYIYRPCTLISTANSILEIPRSRAPQKAFQTSHIVTRLESLAILVS